MFVYTRAHFVNTIVKESFKKIWEIDIFQSIICNFELPYTKNYTFIYKLFLVYVNNILLIVYNNNIL